MLRFGRMIAVLCAAATGGVAPASAQALPLDTAEIEAELVKAGSPTPVGLEPPDMPIGKLMWLKTPTVGVAKARVPARLATRAERLGQFDEADRAWRAIATDPAAKEADRTEAGLALVRIGVTRDPAVARADLAALPEAARTSLGGRVLAARLLMMEGKAAEAAALLSPEIVPALKAGPRHLQIVAADLSLAAWLSADRNLAERLVEWAGASGAEMPLSVPLLRCNAAEGLLPDDRAVVDIGFDQLGELTLATPIWASRPGPMAQTLASRTLGGRVRVGQGIGQQLHMLAQRVQIGCAPHDTVPMPLPSGIEFGDIDSKGMPQPLEGLRKLGSLPRATSATEAWDRAESVGLPKSVLALILVDFVRRSGPQPDLCGAAERLASGADGLPFKSRLALSGALERCDAPEAGARVLLPAVEDTALAAADRRAAAVWVIELSKDPALRAQMATFAGIAPDSCLLGDERELKGIVTEAEDYPESVRRQNIEGGVTFRANRKVSGEITDFAPILARPPFLFDAATAATLKRTPPLPARKAGVPFACTGQIARMRWKLESDEADSAGD